MRSILCKSAIVLGCCYMGSVFASGSEILQNVLQGALQTNERARIERLSTYVDKDTVRFVVSGDQYSERPCGMVLYYGDGTRERFRVNGNNGFPREFSKKLKPGSYVTEVEGAQVSGSPACAGSASASFTVAKQATANTTKKTTATVSKSCPKGWNKVSEDTKTGAFTCAVAPVALECGNGLIYFQDNGIVGCRSINSSYR